MITVIINAWKEPLTIGKAIKCLVDQKYSGISLPFEVIQVSPDKETLEAGMLAAKELKLHGIYSQIKDPLRGKPYALQMAISQAKGDLLVLTDGDVYFGKGAVKKLLKPLLQNPKVGGVTGRPISLNSRMDMFGYFSHILTDSAHHKRITTSINIGEYFISDKSFFPMSGYIIAMRNIVTLPEKAFDDAYISYEIRNKGFEIAYVPSATVYIKNPTNIKDFITQKSRNLSGFAQMKRLGVMQRDKQSRNFLIELQYAFFVISYAKNIKEFFWSLFLFPIRLYIWLIVFYQQSIKKKDIPKTGWERIESTK